MAVKHLLKSSGWTALAAAITVASLPISAAAQERGWGRRGGETAGNISGAAAESGGRSWSGGNGGGWGQRQQSAPQAQAQTQVQAPAAMPAPQQRSWGDGGRSGGGNAAANAGWRGNWAPRNQQPSAAQAQAQAPAQPQRSWGGSEGWQNRQGNGTNERWQGRRGGWNGSQTATPAPAPAPRSAEQWNGDNTRRDTRRDGSSTWSENNRNGSSDWRNRTYRDGNRERRNENWSGDHRRDNWSDNNRWQGNKSWRDNNRRGYSDSHRWNREWRNNDRYDWYSYRNHNHDLFRWGYYHPPYRSYSYRRLSIGFYLDNLFFGSNYWINDPWQYRLPDAYGPYRWIRYYDDALLVDIYSGEVVDVIYSFFW